MGILTKITAFLDDGAKKAEEMIESAINNANNSIDINKMIDTATDKASLLLDSSKTKLDEYRASRQNCSNTAGNTQITESNISVENSISTDNKINSGINLEKPSEAPLKSGINLEKSSEAPLKSGINLEKPSEAPSNNDNTVSGVNLDKASSGVKLTK